VGLCLDVFLFFERKCGLGVWGGKGNIKFRGTWGVMIICEFFWNFETLAFDPSFFSVCTNCFFFGFGFWSNRLTFRL
jgi:hypothetical protein